MWRRLQQDGPEDYVIASGTTTSVRDFIILAFAEVGVEIGFAGEGVAEKGIVQSCNTEYNLREGQEVVVIDPGYFRPTEVALLIGDATKAKEKLGWEPKYSLKELVAEMVAADLNSFKQEKVLLDSGFHVSRQYE